MSGSDLPLLVDIPLEEPIFWRCGRWISRAEFLSHVQHAARALPERKAVINLCTDRYEFMVTFAAALIRGVTTLLPQNSRPSVLADIRTQWEAQEVRGTLIQNIAPPNRFIGTIPRVPARGKAVVLFSSGTTGYPTLSAKSWAELTLGTRAALQRFRLDATRYNIVATVPAQHSYGLESSVLYAMLGPAASYAGHPLYPADVCKALNAISRPRLLVTTPLHLRAMTECSLKWPVIDLIISATSTLQKRLADSVEKELRAPLYEIYGCSEAGALASRRPSREHLWQPYPGVSVRCDAGAYYAEGIHLPEKRELDDKLALQEDGSFELLGRKNHQVKVGGKRITLSELNHRLLQIDGVEDGEFVITEKRRRTRLAAVVLAPSLSVETIRSQLAEALDPVFMPRPLVCVSKLERNGVGKIPRQSLLELIQLHVKGHRYTK